METPQEIVTRLQNLINNGQALLENHQLLKDAKDNISPEISGSVLGEVIKSAVEELGFPTGIGGVARKGTKRLVKQRHKQPYESEVKRLKESAQNWLSEIVTFLSTISEWRTKINKSNSDQLIAQVQKSQKYVRLDTQLRHALKALQNIIRKKLIFNRDIPTPQKQILIRAREPFEASRTLESILSQVRLYVKIIDLWVGVRTLDRLASIPLDVSIHLLTENLANTRRFLRDCRNFQVSHPNFKIRQISEKIIHDRYILTQGQGWHLGHSMKDIGRKYSTITPLDEGLRLELEAVFDQQWSKAKSLSPKRKDIRNRKHNQTQASIISEPSVYVNFSQDPRIFHVLDFQPVYELEPAITPERRKPLPSITIIFGPEKPTREWLSPENEFQRFIVSNPPWAAFRDYPVIPRPSYFSYTDLNDIEFIRARFLMEGIWVVKKGLRQPDLSNKFWQQIFRSSESLRVTLPVVNLRILADDLFRILIFGARIFDTIQLQDPCTLSISYHDFEERSLLYVTRDWPLTSYSFGNDPPEEINVQFESGINLYLPLIDVITESLRLLCHEAGFYDIPDKMIERIMLDVIKSPPLVFRHQKGKMVWEYPDFAPIINEYRERWGI